MSENKINRIKEYCKENIKENKKDKFIGSTNRYSIIEEDSEGRILVPKEQILDNSVLNTVEEKLIDNSFYNMKISSRDELIALFMKMQKVKQVICLKFKT